MNTFDFSTFYLLALDTVQDAVIGVNTAFEVMYWNRGAEVMYEIPRTQAIGAPLSSLYRYEWLNSADEAQALAALKSAKSWRGENLHITSNGKTMHVESCVSVVYQNGVEYGMIAIVRDISERKRIERENSSLIEQLQKSLLKSEELTELLTICAWTGKVKVGSDWISIEKFLERTLGVRISHGISPNALNALRKKYGLDNE